PDSHPADKKPDPRCDTDVRHRSCYTGWAQIFPLSTRADSSSLAPVLLRPNRALPPLPPAIVPSAHSAHKLVYWRLAFLLSRPWHPEFSSTTHKSNMLCLLMVRTDCRLARRSQVHKHPA